MDIPSMKPWPFNEANPSWRRPDRMRSSSTWGHDLLKLKNFLNSMSIIPKGTSTPLPYEGPNLVLGYHLHFTQLPRHEKLKQDTGLSKGFHITIRFDNGFKNMSKGNAQSACLDHLHKMNTLIGKDYSSPNWYWSKPNHQELGIFSQAISQATAQKRISIIERRTCICNGTWVGHQ